MPEPEKPLIPFWAPPCSQANGEAGNGVARFRLRFAFSAI